jgi:[acyl-carrier-protein] S-malonyltransferase
MTLALLCSGQGRQSRDMLDLLQGQTAVVPILDAGSRLLGQDVRTFLRDAPDADIYANPASQLLCAMQALAIYAALFPDGAPCDTLVAGYSVGEVVGWGVAGIWSAQDTLSLIDARARAMDEASQAGDGLAYARGLPRGEVDRLCAAHDADIAIINPAQLFVVGGSRDALAVLCAEAMMQGATGAGALPVHVASHTRRLAAAVPTVEAAFHAMPAVRPSLLMLSATDQTIVRDPARQIDALAAQVARTIDWDATLVALGERGVTQILELGPGSALADMAREALPDVPVRSAADFRAVDGMRHWITSGA